MQVHRCARITFVLAILLGSSGCMTVKAANAVRLGTQGAAVASELEGFTSGTAAQLESYVEGQLILAPLTGRPVPSQQMMDDIARVDSALRARAEVFKELASVYAALNALASYEAAGEVEGALTDVTSSINNYRAVLYPGSTPIPDVAGIIVSEGGGLVASWAQSRQLKKASQAVRERLKLLLEAMEQEKGINLAIRREVVSGSGLAAISLWKIGIGRPNDLLKSQLGGFGLDYAESQLTEQVLGRVQPAVEKVLERRIHRSIVNQERVLDGQIDAVKELMRQHVRFEAGEPLSLDILRSQISVIRGYVEKYGDKLSR